MIDLNVTDIKQYIYCPRIIYFTYCKPVQKKNTFKMEYQLAAYMLLLEDIYKCGVRGGIIHTIPDKRSYYYKNTISIRNKVIEIINSIRELISNESFPEKPNGWKKCKDCEYKNYCGDV